MPHAPAGSPPATTAAAARAKELQSQGVDIVLFDAGEPDFATPAHVKAAGIAAIEQNVTKYSPARRHAGPAPRHHRRACARTRVCTYAPEESVCGQRGQGDLLQRSVRCCWTPGDEAIIPVPNWVSYAERVTAGRRRTGHRREDEASGFKAHAGATRRGHYAAHPSALPEFAMQPNRHGIHGGRDYGLGAVLERHPEVALLTDEIL